MSRQSEPRRFWGDSVDNGGPAKRGPFGLETKLCVKCGGEARRWTGHVVRRGRVVTAGWCEQCNAGRDKHPRMMDLGCIGHRCTVTYAGNLKPIAARAGTTTEEK